MQAISPTAFKGPGFFVFGACESVIWYIIYLEGLLIPDCAFFIELNIYDI